jgi:glycyl-tRNA synthetase
VLAPVKAAILPLVKKDGLPEIANEIIDELKWSMNVQYDEKDAVGRRYRRADANGTPFCITVDHDTKEDRAVTVRDRDTMTQERIAINELKAYLEQRVAMSSWLKGIQS